jgi:predicted ABC-type transport system involved in lysophospholipase L1 biosynthesis ATPase subunit
MSTCRPRDHVAGLAADDAPLLTLRRAVFSLARGGNTAPLELTLGPGGCVWLVGREPAAAVLRALVGLEAPVAGELGLFGRAVCGPGVRAPDHDHWMRLRQGLGYASESAPLLANLDVLDNLILPQAVRGIPDGVARAAAWAGLEARDLTRVAPTRPHALSTADHRRLLRLRALLLPVRLLLLELGPQETAADAMQTDGLEARVGAGTALLCCGGREEGPMPPGTRRIEVRMAHEDRRGCAA